MENRNSLAGWTIRTRLMCLVMACIIPLGIMGSYLFWALYTEKRGLIERHIQETAHTLVRVVDGVSNKDLAHRSRVYNQTFMQGLDIRAEGVSKGKLVSPESITKIAQAVDEFGSIREYLNSLS